MNNTEKECLIDNFKLLCDIQTNVMTMDLDFSLSSSISCDNEIKEISKNVQILKDKIKSKLKEPL